MRMFLSAKRIQTLNLAAVITAAVGVGFVAKVRADDTYRGCYTLKSCGGGYGICGFDPNPAPNGSCVCAPAGGGGMGTCECSTGQYPPCGGK